MRKVILHLAVSADGYIARKNGDVDWLDNLDTGKSDLGFTDFLESCDTIIMGKTSYETTLKLGNGTWPFPKHKTIVFSSKPLESTNNIVFISEDVKLFIQTIKVKKGKNIWLFGGSMFIQSMRDGNLVDEYLITTIPTFIGSGIRLFLPSNNDSELELIKTTTIRDIVTNHYRVKK